MDVVLLILGGIFVFAGIVGCFLPVIPGPPLSYIGLLFIHFTDNIQFTGQFLWLWATITVLVTLLDYLIPPFATKKFGGSQRGATASAIGVVVGIFIIPPWGIIILPFIFSYLVELYHNKDHQQSLKAALGSFVGFLTGTILKLIISCWMVYYYVIEVF